MSPGRRSLLSLSPKQSTALVAAVDGTIHLVESKTMRIIWSFHSGPPIYTSYQADFELLNSSSISFYIDSGDDWDLYVHSLQSGRTMKLPVTIDEFIRSTPTSTEDGAVTLGSKSTTVFEVDPILGTLIRTYSLSDSPSTLDSTKVQSFRPSTVTATSNIHLVNSESENSSPTKTRLQIMRTDYMLQSYFPYSDIVSWNMTVAEIGATLLCEDVDNPPSSGDIALPLPCQSKTFIFRHRNRVLLESLTPRGLTGVQDQHTMVRMPSEGTKHSGIHKDKKMLPGQTSDPVLPSQTHRANVNRGNEKTGVLSPSPLKTNDSDLEDEQNVRIHQNVLLGNLFGLPAALSLSLCIGILVGAVAYRHVLRRREQPRDSNYQKATPSNKKKTQKSEKNNGIVDKLLDCGADGQRIGKLIVSNTEIAKGSNGTVVLKGIYEGRPVAVKRLVQAHHDVAFKEIQNLIASDRHPNIVRWYGVEHDQHFVYLSLERCTCSLDDLVQIYSDASQYPTSGKDLATIEYKAHLESVKNVMPEVNLWQVNAQPSPLLLKLMRDIVSGLVHLHELGIIHRDLKPQNVLITNERSLCAKLSDMGISKRLLGDMSSLGRHATGCGSSGWQAPEQLLHGRQTRAVDLFSLGCVLFFCITGGRHPFGDRLWRDVNVVKNKMDLFLLEDIPEAIDLISRLLNPDPELRPKALEVLHHPLFWNSETRLSFLRDTSDRVELEDRQTGSGLLQALESIATTAFDAKWNEKMEPSFIANIGLYRRYKYDSVRDLLRVMRNKLNHYRELPKGIQELVGPVPEGFDSYFASRFPRLLIEVYKVMSRYCKEEECFQRYFKSNGE